MVKLICLLSPFLFIPLVLLAATAPSATKEELSLAEKTFKLKNQWIHPKIIHEFLPWSSDKDVPLITSIDVLAAEGSNRFYGKFDEKDGAVSFKNDDGTLTSYQWKGLLKNGKHVLLITEKGDGSLIATSLAVFNLSEKSALDSTEQSYTQLLLQIERWISLGDRSKNNIKITNNTIDIDTQCDKSCESKHLKITIN